MMANLSREQVDLSQELVDLKRQNNQLLISLGIYRSLLTY